MQNEAAQANETDQTRKPFATIDDSISQAEQLLTGLKKLAAQKHPLAVRKAGKTINLKGQTSRQIKAGARTYFFDIDRTKEGKPYLKLTESRLRGEAKRLRQIILIFPEQAQEFADAVTDMVSQLA